MWNSNQVSDITWAERLLGGLTLGKIPIAGSKRRSIAISLHGKLYRIGRIPANKALVIIRGNLRLLYVAPDYRNYRYAARQVFGAIARKIDIDHVLGRKLTEHHRFWYCLVTRLPAHANRSHGSLERPPAPTSYRIVLDKFCYVDDRILAKMLGLPASMLPEAAQRSGYDIEPSHRRPLTFTQALPRAACAER